MTAPYDAYRDPDSRKLMLEYVMASRVIDASAAARELRALNHVGLAHVYQDATRGLRCERVEYDPLAIGRI